jgi:hypothetical protein
MSRLVRMTCEIDVIPNTRIACSYFAKNEDAASALELKKALVQYDRTLLVADPRRMEPKKVGLMWSTFVFELANPLSSLRLSVRRKGSKSQACQVLPIEICTYSTFSTCDHIARHVSPILWLDLPRSYSSACSCRSATARIYRMCLLH